MAGEALDAKRQSLELFQALDANKDGGLCRDEFNAALRSSLILPGTPGSSNTNTTVTRSALATRDSEQANGRGGDFAGAAPLQNVAPMNPAMSGSSWMPSVPAIPEPSDADQNLTPAVRKALAEAEQRIAKAQDTYAKLSQEGETLQKENLELKEVVERARQNAERRILKKRAENVQLLSDNAELEHFTLEARRLAELKAMLPPTKTNDLDALQKDGNAIKKRLDRVLQRPERTPLDGTMESPKSGVTSLGATPRIEAVQEWRMASSQTDFYTTH